MSKSRQQLVNQALLNNGGKASGQAAAPEDYATVDGLVEGMMANLASREIWQWGNPDDIDDDAFLILADLLGKYYAAEPFGLQRDPAFRLDCEQRLRELQPVILSGQPQKVDYF